MNYFWIFVFIGVGFCLKISYCDGAKLFCNDERYSGHYYDEDDVVFKFYSGGWGEPLFESTSGFDPLRKTVVIIHGFRNFAFSNYDWMRPMARRYVRKEPLNVIIVEWLDPTAKTIKYVLTSLKTEFVAEKLREYIWKNLGDFAEYNNYHFIGHSLGAHIAGQTARLLKDKHGVSAKRVTALDPAYLCFESKDATLRLRKTDAEFVDVIHTQSGPEENRGHLGTYEPMGHLDFYPNGGDYQPGCETSGSNVCDGSNIWKDIGCFYLKAQLFIPLRLGEYFFDIDFSKFQDQVLAGENFGCNHGKATEYLFFDGNKWANPVDFPIHVTPEIKDANHQCNDKTCVEMGINAEMYKDREGTYYVDTY